MDKNREFAGLLSMRSSNQWYYLSTGEVTHVLFSVAEKPNFAGAGERFAFRKRTFSIRERHTGGLRCSVRAMKTVRVGPCGRVFSR